MSSIRPKPILDEQSFQGLLAAAFTIQEHYDRQKNGGSEVLLDDLKVALEPEPIQACERCGTPLEATDEPCPSCTPEPLRPGERLQRKWASMWLMSQEQGLWLEPNADRDAAAKPALLGANGNGLNKVATENPSPIAGRKPVIERAARKLPSESDLQIPYYPDASLSDSLFGQGQLSQAADPNAETEWPDEQETIASDDLEGSERALSRRALQFPASADEEVQDDLPPSTALLPPLGDTGDSKAQTPRRQPEWEHMLSILRDRRSDLYLGLAITVAAVALLWPSGAARRTQMHPWQRVLIAMGIAEAAPPVTIHFHGDPNLKVWVDTHTALYYCPGDELYGKSPDGHFTTQRDAQLDRFEPAERSVCTE